MNLPMALVSLSLPRTSFHVSSFSLFDGWVSTHSRLEAGEEQKMTGGGLSANPSIGASFQYAEREPPTLAFARKCIFPIEWI